MEIFKLFISQMVKLFKMKIKKINFCTTQFLMKKEKANQEKNLSKKEKINIYGKKIFINLIQITTNNQSLRQKIKISQNCCGKKENSQIKQQN